MPDVTPPQPGWYADPENSASERWWNGSGWSDHQRDATATGTAAPPAAPPTAAAGDAVPAVPVAAEGVTDSAGFTFGSPAPAGSDPRPDPYSAPAVGVAQPYYSSPYVAAPYGAPAYGSSTNGLALAGVLVSSIAWMFIPLLGPIAGIILSAFGLTAAKQREAAGNPNSGRGLAMAGLIVGIIIGAISLLVVIAYIGFFVAAFSYTGR